jgi:hypothetical protein
MKLAVTFDQQGTIVALAPVMPVGSGVTSLAPRLLDGQAAAVLDVPEPYAQLPLLELHTGLRVDVGSSPHQLVPNDETQTS